MAGYYGEAVLYVGYLWNLSPSRVLLNTKTLFEALYGRKPDLSHLWVFGARCFAHIPVKLHTKNSLHSCEAVFLGYPDAIKGWRLCDVWMGSFFNARDVIFDEESVLQPRDDSEALRLAPSPPTVSKGSSPPVNDTLPGSGGVVDKEATHSSSIGTDIQSDAPSSDSPSLSLPKAGNPEPCHSTQNRILTEKGAKYAAEMCCQWEHLDKLWAAKAGLQLDVGNSTGTAMLVAMLEVTDALRADEDHIDPVPEGQAGLILTEQAHLSI